MSTGVNAVGPGTSEVPAVKKASAQEIQEQAARTAIAKADQTIFNQGEGSKPLVKPLGKPALAKGLGDNLNTYA